MRQIAWIALGCCVGLSACHSTKGPNAPQFLTQKVYHGAAQSYDFDLGSTVLRGELKLNEFCSVEGTSLDIVDQLSQQVRIDTLNLNNNAKLGSTLNSTLEEVSPQILAQYEATYQATASDSKTEKVLLGDAVFSRLSSESHNIDLAILSRYGYAYVVQLNSPITGSNATQSRNQLQTLLKSLSIPGQKKANSNAELPSTFDLSQTDSSARKTWQKANCP